MNTNKYQKNIKNWEEKKINIPWSLLGLTTCVGLLPGKKKKSLDETSYFQIMQRLRDQQKISIIKN